MRPPADTTTPAFSNGANPFELTVTSYAPGVRPLTAYSPVASVDKALDPRSLDMTILAPGTTAPEGSVTSPFSDPVNHPPFVSGRVIESASIAARQQKRKSFFICVVPLTLQSCFGPEPLQPFQQVAAHEGDRAWRAPAATKKGHDLAKCDDQCHH